MNPLRRGRAGFTLTEILMATGILGIGLTMVASVFPVAVDQSRRSQDATLAALSARSVAAAIRAQREKILPYLRRNAREKMIELTTNQRARIPISMRNYNPSFFLYYREDPNVALPPVTGGGTARPIHKYARKYFNSPGELWMAGGYIPVVFATPLNADSGAPWLLTIAIYKSQGGVPFNLDAQGVNSVKYLKHWGWTSGSSMPCRGTPGTYVINWAADGTSSLPSLNAARVFHGEAYLIERVDKTPGQPTIDELILFAAATNWQDKTPKPPTNVPATFTFNGGVAPDKMQLIRDCITLPGAIAVYHTVVGD